MNNNDAGGGGSGGGGGGAGGINGSNMQVDHHGSGSTGAPGGPIPGLMFNLRKAILDVMR